MTVDSEVNKDVNASAKSFLLSGAVTHDILSHHTSKDLSSYVIVIIRGQFGSRRETQVGE